MDYIEFVEGVLAHYLDSGLAEKPWVEEQTLAQDMALTRAQIRPALDDLASMGVIYLDTVIRPNRRTDLLRHGVTLRSLWPQVFEKFITPEQEKFLVKLVEISERRGETDAEMEIVNVGDVYDALGWEFLDNPDARRICDALDQHGFLVQWGAINYQGVRVRASYQGVVRATQEVATVWHATLAKLLAEGETITVDIKQELQLNSQAQRVEFVRDVLSIANTKASGQERYLVIGFDDTTLKFVKSVDPSLKRDHLEDLLNEYTHPQPRVDWIVVPTAGGEAGIVIVTREPAKIPYRLSRDVGRLENGTIFVRHGTHVALPNEEELADLIAEGERARETPSD